MKNQKYRYIFLLFFGLFPCMDSSEIIATILDCHMLFIESNYISINKVYIYDMSNSSREFVYYFDNKNEKKELLTSISKSTLQKLIRKEESNTTHIYLDFPLQTIIYNIEILSISYEGSMSTIQTTLFYKSNARCFITGNYYTEACIISCSMLFIQPHPMSRKIDRIYVYDKDINGKKNLLFYFNTKDKSDNKTEISNSYINAKLSNSTNIILVRPTLERFYKIELITVSEGFQSSFEINLFYNNITECFERVSDYMDLQVVLNNNTLRIIPDFKIRIFECVYLYDVTSSSKRELVYFYKRNNINNRINPIQKDTFIDSLSSNNTHIKLTKSYKQFHKIEIIVISQGFVSRLETELFFDTKTSSYFIISLGETRIFGVILNPVVPIAGQPLSVNLKYSLKHQHQLTSLYFQAIEEYSNNPIINICIVKKEKTELNKTENCNLNAIWANRVRSDFHNISTTIKFKTVLPIDNDYTFIWNMNSSDKDEENDNINVMYYFNITVKVTDQVPASKNKYEKLMIFVSLVICLLLVIFLCICFFRRQKSKKRIEMDETQQFIVLNESI